MTTRLPRGIRNNNPGNIERGTVKWQGMSHIQDDPRFIRFDHPKWGIRAIIKLLKTYYLRHNLQTVQGMINRYAPAVENNTGAYIQAVADRLGVKPMDRITLDEKTMVTLAQAIVVHENGRPPKGMPTYWYEDDLYREAYSLS